MWMQAWVFSTRQTVGSYRLYGLATICTRGLRGAAIAAVQTEGCVHVRDGQSTYELRRRPQ